MPIEINRTSRVRATTRMYPQGYKSLHLRTYGISFPTAFLLIIIPLIARAQAPTIAPPSSIQDRLAHQAEYLMGQGYSGSSFQIVDRITAGESKSFPVQLVRGASNAIVGICGANCDHVEISLFDSQHKKVGRSPETQDTVIIKGAPPNTGAYEVEIAVPGCHVPDCEIGLTVLRQPGDNSALLAEIRSRLYELNFDPGPIDGTGDIELTNRAIQEFEAVNKMARIGQPTAELLQRLRGANAPNPWGTILYMKNGETWGMSWGHITRNAAVAAARSSCGASCTSEVSFFGTECGAFAHSETGWAIVARENVQAAKDEALIECRAKKGSCRIIATVCASGSDQFGAPK
jgi:hypothetical protein